MSATPYVDTSALAKLYVSEIGSQSFQRYASELASGWISRVAVVEFRCLLARRLRAGTLTAAEQAAARTLFESDVARGLWQVAPLEDHHVVTAAGMIDRLAPLPLRTLDALHLAVALSLGARNIATSDRAFADAGAALGFQVVTF